MNSSINITQQQISYSATATSKWQSITNFMILLLSLLLAITFNVKAQTSNATLTLGNIVWYDQNNDGFKQNTENGLEGVTVKLYADANNDNVADSSSISTTTSNSSGLYSFSNLNPGNYVVGIMIPTGYNSSTVNGSDPDYNVDSDDNGQVFMGSSEIRGLSITLLAGTEPNGSNTNSTYDFGLYQLNPFAPLCNSFATTSGGSTVQFLGITYTGTGTNIRSTYTYKITSGCSPTISHFGFGGLNCISCMNSSSDFFSVNGSGTYSYGTDPTTGICGIKYDYGIACNNSNIVSFSLNGYYGVGNIKFALKAGQSIEYADICGPDCTRPTVVTNPDFNSTFVNVSVLGNVKTNDRVPVGTTYETSPTLLSSPTGSVATITMNSNGTYSFTANTIGVYTYDVPVCVPGQSAPCPPTKLVITVLGASSNVNAPVANVDIATTNFNTPVTLKTLANDEAGNPSNSLVTAFVIVTVAPLNGTTSVNATTGDITYTPNGGFVGVDTLTYRVCDNQTPAKCATALQIITVKPSGTINNTTAAADDYKITLINTAATGNVKTNDSDAEGNTQTVTPQTITVAGKGTLVLAANGSYTFTPVTGFTGPIDYIYTTCDNGTPQACVSATLHILVKPLPTPDLTPRINLNPNNIIGTSSLEITVQVNELSNIVTDGSVITLYVDKQNLFSNFSFNSAQTVNKAGQSVQNSLFTVDAVSNSDFYIITTNAVFANSLRRLTFSVTVNPGQTKGVTPLNIYLLDGSGGETNFTNNSNSTVLTFSF
jgi:hypothetical protein